MICPKCGADALAAYTSPAYGYLGTMPENQYRGTCSKCGYQGVYISNYQNRSDELSIEKRQAYAAAFRRLEELTIGATSDSDAAVLKAVNELLASTKFNKFDLGNLLEVTQEAGKTNFSKALSDAGAVIVRHEVVKASDDEEM